jgi:hypothetical protein
MEIFEAVRQWATRSQEPGRLVGIVEELRLPLIKLEDLLNVVRNSGLLHPDAILDAIKEQKEKLNSELKYRGFLRELVERGRERGWQIVTRPRCARAPSPVPLLLSPPMPLFFLLFIVKSPTSTWRHQRMEQW